MLSVRDAWKVIYASRALMMSGVQLEDLVARTAATLAGTLNQHVRPCWPQWSTRLPALWNWPRADIPRPAGPLRAEPVSGWRPWAEGVGAPPGSQTVVRTAMEPGDALVVYTDGVVNSTRDMVEGPFGSARLGDGSA